MWCALHVKSGSEAAAEAFLSGLFPRKVNARCFHLTRYRRKKYGGEWRTAQENLLPGYVFIDTDQPEVVYRELKRAPDRQLLFSSGAFVSALKGCEVEFMEGITDEGGSIALSRVRVMDNGEIRYLSGPLLKVSHKVRRIRLHERVAEVEADFLGEKHLLYLGIEIEPCEGFKN